MALVQDALASPTLFYSKDRIVKEQLKEIIEDLDLEDIISIVFLFTHSKTNISQLIKLLGQNPCFVFLEIYNEKDWEEKLLEILIITGNINVVRKLGYAREEIEAIKINYSCDVHNVSPKLNRIIKSLYFLCQQLENIETKRLIDKVNQQLGIHDTVEKNNACLEIHILNWLQRNYFTIDDKNPKLNDLIENLKVLGCLAKLPIDFNFDYWKTIRENSLNGSDFSKHQNNQQTDNLNSLQLQNIQSIQNNKNLKSPWDRYHEKLCIIVNQDEFYTGKFKGQKRKGSERDVKNLIETFENCGFTIDLHENLLESYMMILLDSLSEPEYKKYGCIFICILSHGCEGAVYFSDDKIVEHKTIGKKFCCENLKNTFKCVILQACQGQKAGIIETNSSSEVVEDGPSDNPMYHDNYILFQATINEFVAFRDENEGTWFIQEICNVIRDSSPIEILQWTKEVTNRVKNRRGKTKSSDKYVVQLPRATYSITNDYILTYKKNLKGQKL